MHACLLPLAEPPSPAVLKIGGKESDTVLLGAGFPSIPSKLVKEDGSFVEMQELLPEKLRAMEELDYSRPAKKVKMVRYTGVGAVFQSLCGHHYLKTLDRVPHLLSYQALILDAQREYPLDRL